SMLAVLWMVENAILRAYEGQVRKLRHGTRIEGFGDCAPHQSAISLLEVRPSDGSRGEDQARCDDRNVTSSFFCAYRLRERRRRTWVSRHGAGHAGRGHRGPRSRGRPGQRIGAKVRKGQHHSWTARRGHHFEGS